ncbi:SAV_2336 N-terminal domain-related protein [Aliinostoc sp. HNIBRCY26]|uniref:SAV_2336 N-terminal domain-related protein n=1 Tax=Aliinostoc sp. HNIBRCY26 TaxID=3418997 RepID=UPI003CFC803A
MSENSGYDAVQRFVTILDHSGLKKRLELSDEDIADTLWLALHMGVENPRIKEKPPQNPKETANIPENTNTNIQAAEPIEPPINIYTPPSNLSAKSQTEENIEGLPFPTPTAPALPNKLQISRALRPLMRKVASYSRTIVDIEATVNRIVEALIVEQEIWLPITKPQPERWLSLELVIEENRSSFIWQETINELIQILDNYGIFFNVRVWNLVTDEQGKLQLISRRKGRLRYLRIYNYRELYHINGRGLILLVSDCVSNIWQQETIYNWLQKWSHQSSTAILQLFPERLWLSSELGLGYKVKVSSFHPGVPNTKLIYQEDLDIEQALNLPIITLESASLKTWAKVIAGYGRTQTPAIILDLEFVQEQINQKTTSPVLEISPETIVDRFLATASPTAQKLAGLMAAVPVSLPVVHLIQKTMLPQSTPINVAEVFLSGMITKKQNDPVSVAWHYEYDFVEGVRKLLNQAMLLAETENVLDVVSEYIAEKMGLSLKTFTSLLLNLPDLSAEQQENLLPFAHVTTEVLRNLGGRYAEFAEKVAPNDLPPTLDNYHSLLQLFAGEYICEVKLGYENWRGGLELLSISPQGKVKFRSRLGLTVIENWQIEGQQISWSFEDNRTAASITFTENSGNAYFWERYQEGKLFEGWLNYPHEGRIDFRGYLSTSFAHKILRASGETCPSGYTLVTYEEAIENREILSRKLETWDIARIAGGGSMDGSGYDSKIRQQDERGLGHSLCKRLDLGVIQFTIATLERQLNNPEEWIINYQQGQAEYITEVLAEGVELEMIEIPAGTFLMGAPEDELESEDDERPQHQVTVPTFYIGRYPITQAQWQAVAALPQVARELSTDPSKFKGSNRPVEQVSWYDAVEFCARLSQHTGKSYRLPSEAEWEYACRARTTTPFHFGETITSELANYNANYSYGTGVKGSYREVTLDVGSFGVANAFGLCDMHGNVWEWCLDDSYKSYEGAPEDGSAWSDDNNNLYQKQGVAVLRGGSWLNYPGNCRSASRSIYDRASRGHFNIIAGFRVVCGVGRIPRRDIKL